MKKILYFFMILFAGVSFTSCSSDDDEPAAKDLKGIWMEDGDPDSWALLITSEVWIWDDGNYGDGGASMFVPFMDASYETLAKTFGPNDDFCLYRYDSKSGYYLVYSGDEKDANGNILFDTEPMLMNISVKDNVMTLQESYVENCEEFDSRFHNTATKAELMSNKEYGCLPDGVKIVTTGGLSTYTRFK